LGGLIKLRGRIKKYTEFDPDIRLDPRLIKIWSPSEPRMNCVGFKPIKLTDLWWTSEVIRQDLKAG